MLSPARSPSANGAPPYRGSDTAPSFDGLSFDELEAGERMCPPAQHGSGMLGVSILVLVLVGCGWGVIELKPEWLALMGERVAAVSQSTRAVQPAAVMADGEASDTSTPAVTGPEIATPEHGAAGLGVPEFGAAGTPVMEVTAPPAPVGAGAAHDGVEAQADASIETASIGEAAAPAPLPPPRIDGADPYQRRAAAAGLNPELSRVLLRKLSAADYKHAQYAIDTAMTNTADDQVFLWPRKARSGEAMFRVHFVAGAPAQCRRYVVTVAKDGWSTTALPMERCGAGIGSAQRRSVHDAGKARARPVLIESRSRS